MASSDFKRVTGILLLVASLLMVVLVASLVCNDADAQIPRKILKMDGQVDPVKLEMAIRDLYSQVSVADFRWAGIRTGSITVASSEAQDTVYFGYKYADTTYSIVASPVYGTADGTPLAAECWKFVLAEKTDSSTILRRANTGISQEYNWIAIGTLAEEQ